MKPRILVCSAHCPHGPTYGAQLRTLHIARSLKQFGEVGMALFPYEKLDSDVLDRTGKEFDLRGVFYLNEAASRAFGVRIKREFDPYCGDTEGIRPGLSDVAEFERIAKDYDLIWFQGLSIPNCLGHRVWKRSILDIDDVPSQIYKSRSEKAGNWVTRMKESRMSTLWRRRERVLLERFESLCVCSEEDRRYLGNSNRIHVVPNGFEPPPSSFERRPSVPARVGFIGTLRYSPNRDGLEWMVRHVWPLLKQHHPNLRLRLVGAGTDGEIAGMGPDIDGLGFVENADDEIATWALTVVPILVGGGTRAKIAEAFSRKCPVVSTSKGCHGYQLKSGFECLLADDPESFSSACATLLENPLEGNRMADLAWDRYEAEWDWKAIAPRVGRAVQDCLESVRVKSA